MGQLQTFNESAGAPHVTCRLFCSSLADADSKILKVRPRASPLPAADRACAQNQRYKNQKERREVRTAHRCVPSKFATFRHLGS